MRENMKNLVAFKTVERKTHRIPQRVATFTPQDIISIVMMVLLSMEIFYVQQRERKHFKRKNKQCFIFSNYFSSDLNKFNIKKHNVNFNVQSKDNRVLYRQNTLL